MNLFNPELMYDFHVKELEQTEALRRYADHAVKEIKSTYGWDTDIHVHIEPEAKDKHLFTVTMTVQGLGESIVVQKSGKQVLSMMRKVRKSVMRQIHSLSRRRIQARRRPHFRERRAS